MTPETFAPSSVPVKEKKDARRKAHLQAALELVRLANHSSGSVAAALVPGDKAPNSPTGAAATSSPSTTPVPRNVDPTLDFLEIRADLFLDQEEKNRSGEKESRQIPTWREVGSDCEQGTGLISGARRERVN